jgi:hypothetical protein
LPASSSSASAGGAGVVANVRRRTSRGSAPRSSRASTSKSRARERLTARRPYYACGGLRLPGHEGVRVIDLRPRVRALAASEIGCESQFVRVALGGITGQCRLYSPGKGERDLLIQVMGSWAGRRVGPRRSRRIDSRRWEGGRACRPSCCRPHRAATRCRNSARVRRAGGIVDAHAATVEAELPSAARVARCRVGDKTPALAGFSQGPRPSLDRRRLARQKRPICRHFVERSGAGVEPTEPWVTRPHRF